MAVTSEDFLKVREEAGEEGTLDIILTDGFGELVPVRNILSMDHKSIFVNEDSEGEDGRAQASQKFELFFAEMSHVGIWSLED